MRRRLCARAPHGRRFATERATRAQQIAPSVHLGLHRGLPVIVACVTDSRRTAAGRLAKARLPEDRTGAEAEIFRTPMQEARHVSPCAQLYAAGSLLFRLPTVSNAVWRQRRHRPMAISAPRGFQPGVSRRAAAPQKGATKLLARR